MRWFEEQRMAWIAESLRIFGFVNRHHLMAKFGISEIQASHDLTKFGESHALTVRYNSSTKRYERKG